jgi:Domain found in Dishevelled, Egl-10, and Pleckstrin (DEP)/Phosphatidylinositol 3- and 4-kinase
MALYIVFSPEIKLSPPCFSSVFFSKDVRLGVRAMSYSDVSHFRNYLAWSNARGFITEQQLAELLLHLDNFVDVHENGQAYAYHSGNDDDAVSDNANNAAADDNAADEPTLDSIIDVDPPSRNAARTEAALAAAASAVQNDISSSDSSRSSTETTTNSLSLDRPMSLSLPRSSRSRGMSSDGSSSWQSRDSNDSGVSDSFEDVYTVATLMQHPLTGVRLGRRRYMLKVYYNCFVGTEAVDWLVENKFAVDRHDAVRIGRALIKKGFIAHVTSTHGFRDKRYFYVFTEHPAPFSLQLEPASSSDKATRVLSSLMRLVYHIHEDSVMDWFSEDELNQQYLEWFYPAVMLWGRMNIESAPAISDLLISLAQKKPALALQLYGFNTANACKCTKFQDQLQFSKEQVNTIQLVAQQTPAKMARKYESDGTLVLHPFGEVHGTDVLKTAEEKLAAEEKSVGQAIKVVLKKEFTSAAKPAWLGFQDPNEPERVVQPEVVAKRGDDLRQDLSCSMLFRAMQAFCQGAGVDWLTGEPPVMRTYRVAVMSADSGYLEFVKGRVVEDMQKESDWDNVDLKQLAPSIVGSLIAGFIIGLRDRHSENTMVVDRHDGKGHSLMQIDFGYLLLASPGGLPLDTPRLTLPAILVKLLKKTPGHSAQFTLLDDIKRDVITAYKVLRKHHPPLVSFMTVCLSAVLPPQRIESFAYGKHVFRTGMSERNAVKWFTDKVESQLSEVVLRRGAKQAIVRAYYAARHII